LSTLGVRIPQESIPESLRPKKIAQNGVTRRFNEMFPGQVSLPM
jgi:hypothetical protein